MTPKIYILQKDLPDAKAGDRFVTSPVNSEFYQNVSRESLLSEYHKSYIEKFTDWFKPEEDTIPPDIFIETENYHVTIDRKNKIKAVDLSDCFKEISRHINKMTQ